MSKQNNLNFKNKDKKLLMLIDSHALLHRGYHAMTGFATRDGRPTGALFGFLKMILNAQNIGQPDYIVACYDLPKPTFRHIAYADYKGTRTKTDEDLKVQINQSKDFCKALSIPVCELEGYEADDMLGTISELYKDKYNIMIVSGDMDTLQLVDDSVKVCTLRKGSEIATFGLKEVKEKYELTPLQIPDYKGLSGDPSDNIPGVSGVGPKTAIKVLKEFKTVENLYEAIKHDEEEVLKVVKGKVYESIKASEEEATFSKTLATIRRDAPIDVDIFYNFEKDFGKEVNKDEYIRLCNLYELHSLKKAFESAGDNGEVIPGGYVEDSKSYAVVDIDGGALASLQVMSLLLSSEHINLSFERVKELHGIDASASSQEAETVLLKKLEAENLLSYFNNFEAPLFKILSSMKDVGLMIDIKELEEQSKSVQIKIKQIEKEIHELAGEEFLISSPKQLGVILYDKLGLGRRIKKTATGARSTNAEMLDKIKGEHEVVTKVIHWREMSKVYNTYIEPLAGFVAEDGAVHPHFLQAGAATGRFSCENPNMQNLPRNTEIGTMFRKVFVSRPGKVFISADYSQIDLRSAAMLSQDEKLIDIFRRNIDIHKGVAAQVLNKNIEEVTDEERRKAKAINFGILYGMGVSALKDAMGVERDVAQQFYDNFKSTFSTLMSYLDKVKLDATKTGHTLTLFGRRRDVPLLKSPLPFLRAQGERIAINAPVQGTSSDIIRLGMIRLSKRLEEDHIQESSKNKNIHLLLQIHDELVLECDEANKDYFAKIIKEELEKVVSVGDYSVSLIANVSFGKSLYEL